MLKLGEEVQVYVLNEPVDGRKSINGLSALIAEESVYSLRDGSVYVFYNKARDRIKCLFWEKNGFVLYHKRLERGKFKFQKRATGKLNISHEQLDWLMAGLDFMLMSEFPALDFSQYF